MDNEEKVLDDFRGARGCIVILYRQISGKGESLLLFYVNFLALQVHVAYAKPLKFTSSQSCPEECLELQPKGRLFHEGKEILELLFRPEANGAFFRS